MRQVESTGRLRVTALCKWWGSREQALAWTKQGFEWVGTPVNLVAHWVRLSKVESFFGKKPPTGPVFLLNPLKLQSVHFKSRTDFFPVFQLSMNPAQPFLQDEEDYIIMITLTFIPAELFEKWLGAMTQRSLKTALICSSVQVKKILSMEHYFTLSFPCNRIANQDLNWGFKPEVQHFDLFWALVTLKKVYGMPKVRRATIK